MSQPRQFHLPEPDPSWPWINAAGRLASLAAKSGERLLDLQYQAAAVAVNELEMRHAALLQLVDANAALLAWPHWHEGNAQRMTEIARAWSRAANQTQTELLDIWRECLWPAGREAPPLFERRLNSVVINFPDRRRSAA